jgi:hypothetical protein
MAPQRNDPCPCGSGKKYKACCAVKRQRSQWIAIVSVVVFAGVAAWALKTAIDQSDEAPDGKVWSSEHGHWHPAPGAEPLQRPAGLPLDAEWSPEHGHYHDANGTAIDLSLGQAPEPATRPEGVPADAVWSSAHGHYHDANGQEIQADR